MLPNLEKILRNLHIDDLLPANSIYPEKEEAYSATLNAVRYACKLISHETKADEKEAVYYLV